MDIFKFLRSVFAPGKNALKPNKCACGAGPHIEFTILQGLTTEARVKCKACGCCTEWRDSDHAMRRTSPHAAEKALVKQVVDEWNAGQFIIAEDITRAGELS